MKLPSIPSPGDVLSAVEGLRGGIGDALALVPRLGAVVGRVEQIVDRVSAVVDRAEGLLDRADSALTGLDAIRTRADEIVDRASGTQHKADEAIGRVAATQQKADDAITGVDRTTSRAGETLARADGLVERMAPLVVDYAEPLRLFAPSIRRLAETLEPNEVEAMVTLVDRLPQLVVRLDETVLPVLANMDNVGDDVHDLLDTMQDLREVVKGFPGSRLFRRRGAEEIAQEEGPEAAEGPDGSAAAGA